MQSNNDKRVKTARQVRRLIQRRQDAENWLRDWEELGEAYHEAYHQQLEKAAGFTPTQFLVRARGWLARDLNRYVGESLKNWKRGKTKNSPFNPVYKVNGGLVDIVHAARQAETPEQKRDLVATLEKKLPDIEAAAVMMNQKVMWYKGVVNYVRDMAGMPRPETPVALALPSPEEVESRIAEAMVAPEEEIEDSVDDEEDEIAGDELEEGDDDE
jgi:hypothetical protein